MGSSELGPWEARPTCGECARCVEVCCDYGVCGAEFEGAFAGAGAGGGTRWDTAREALGWVAGNLVDMQGAACESFERPR